MGLEQYIKLHYDPKFFEKSSDEVSYSYGTLACNDVWENTEEENIERRFSSQLKSRPVRSLCLRKCRKSCHDFSSFMDSLPDFETEGNFGDALNEWMIKKELTAPQVYKGCNMSKSNFSQHLSAKRHPSKETVLALCIGLQLTLKEAKVFIEQAGYGFSRFSLQDVIVQYFLVKNFYDIDVVNIVLVNKGEAPLTGKK